jgi:UDP-N-acetylmuramyl tripeptide synthase
VKVSSLTGTSSVSGKTPYLAILDRHEAIAEAIRTANPGDVVVLAGKGHEDWSDHRRREMHFDDREVARRNQEMRCEGRSSDCEVMWTSVCRFFQ